MARVKHKLVILSGKGGVGKSTVTGNLATALAWKGRPNLIGILDADIMKPVISKMRGKEGTAKHLPSENSECHKKYSRMPLKTQTFFHNLYEFQSAQDLYSLYLLRDSMVSKSD
jgi:Mrp family chromosome partitioning ATPase